MMRRSNDNLPFATPLGLGVTHDTAGRFGFVVENRLYSPAEHKTLAEIISCLACGYDCGDLSAIAADIFDADPRHGRAVFVYLRGWSIDSDGKSCPVFGAHGLDEA